MEARLYHTAALGLILLTSVAQADVTCKSPNFTVSAPTGEAAQKVAAAAEHYRRELAIAWLGKEIPAWKEPCPIKVEMGRIGAGGETTFSFDRGRVFGWRMRVQGTLDRILDSVIPHEVNHTIFASHFRRPLPRWADEGAATLTEDVSERRRQMKLLEQVIRTNRRIPLRQLFHMTEYPSDHNDILTLYAEGYSLADLLVQMEGRTTFLEFLTTGHRKGWDEALKTHYGYDGIGALERQWHEWVLAGSPGIEESPGKEAEVLASAADRSSREEGVIIRSQSPEAIQPLAMLQRGLRSSASGTGRFENTEAVDRILSSESGESGPLSRSTLSSLVGDHRRYSQSAMSVSGKSFTD